MNQQNLNQYRELRVRVDEKFREIHDAYPSEFQCRMGCHSCCKPGLTVNRLEKEALREVVAARETELRALAAENPFGGKRCSFLSANGACAVYEARPFVCRTHGAPLQFRPLEAAENERARDVCPLNFKQGIAELPATAVINLDTINTLLALLSQRAFPGDASRTPLTVDGLLAP